VTGGIDHLPPGNAARGIAYDCRGYRIGNQVLDQRFANRGTQNLQIEPAWPALPLGSMHRSRVNQGRSRFFSNRYSQNGFKTVAAIVKEVSYDKSGRPDATLKSHRTDLPLPNRNSFLVVTGATARGVFTRVTSGRVAVRAR